MKIGDTVWVDEGDSVGCEEYRGVIESIDSDGTLQVRVDSHPIVTGASTGSLRRADPELVFEVEGSR